ncbi:unnamed protein product [Polarella glacialis]|uniref:Uncharacterized protein n=1 Tax=Polarella glacialis TaxID=89957 RepID=A0A813ERZ3_POLGL|nr:unnamed protein product [Polarella glacialis]
MGVHELGSQERAGLNTRSTGLPDLRLLLAWVASLLGFGLWFWTTMDSVDRAVLFIGHVVILPIFSERATPRLMACMGSPIVGTISGMQLIDVVFDLAIVNERTISDGVESFDPRRVAYLYYHTVVTAPHVNGILLCMVLISIFGSIIGFGRSTPEIVQCWKKIGAVMSVSMSSYLGVVVPRYLHIRDATVYDVSLFENWTHVVAVRMFLFASLLSILPLMFELQGSPEQAAGNHDPSKPHEE